MAVNPSVRKAFLCDPDFCPQCGSILPLPGNADVVTCSGCSFKIDVTEFDGIESKSKIIFNKRHKKTAGLKSEDFSGPVADKKCPKCGNEGMTYATRQTRSADEGQTVFYSCPKCSYQETEYS